MTLLETLWDADCTTTLLLLLSDKAPIAHTLTLPEETEFADPIAKFIVIWYKRIAKEEINYTLIPPLVCLHVPHSLPLEATETLQETLFNAEFTTQELLETHPQMLPCTAHTLPQAVEAFASQAPLIALLIATPFYKIATLRLPLESHGMLTSMTA